MKEFTGRKYEWEGFSEDDWWGAEENYGNQSPEWYTDEYREYLGTLEAQPSDEPTGDDDEDDGYAGYQNINDMMGDDDDDFDDSKSIYSQLGNTASDETPKQEAPVKSSRPERQERRNREEKSEPDASALVKKVSDAFMSRCQSPNNDAKSLLEILWVNELLAETLQTESMTAINEIAGTDEWKKTACKFFVAFYTLAFRGGIDFDKFIKDKAKTVGFSELSIFTKIYELDGVGNVALKGLDITSLTEQMGKTIDDSRTLTEAEGKTAYTEVDFNNDVSEIVKFVTEKRTSLNIDEKKQDLLDAFLDSVAPDYLDIVQSTIISELVPMWSVHPYKALFYGYTAKRMPEEAEFGKELPSGVETTFMYAISPLAKKLEKDKRFTTSRLQLEDISQTLAKDNGLIIEESRSYDVDKIVEGYCKDKSSVLYFPRKHEEFLRYSKWGYVGDGYCNADTSSLVNPETYYKKELKKGMEQTVLAACSAYLDKEHSGWDSLESLEEDKKIVKDLRDFMLYLGRCLVCVFPVTQLDFKPGKRGTYGIARFGFRLVAPEVTKSYPTILTEKSLLKQACDTNTVDVIGAKGSLQFNPDDYFTKVWIIHIVKDSNFVYAQPQFAYKVLKMLQRQGRKLSWKDEILIGENEDFTPYTFSKGSKFHDNKLHCIFAGSRSGKGVMCSNIFCTAIASSMPIFYLDGKPDTATLLYSLSKGRMFAINSGNYVNKFDPDDYFKYTQDINNFRIPSVLKQEPCFNDIKSLNYMAYIKGALLVLELTFYLTKVKTGAFAEWAKKTGVTKNGFVLVLDELNIFFSEYGSTLYGKALSYHKNASKLGKKLTRKKDETDEAFNERLKEELNSDGGIIANIPNVYSTMLMESLRNTITTLSGIANAKQGGIADNLHIFMIGQNLSEIISSINFSAKSASTLLPIINADSNTQMYEAKGGGVNHFLTTVLSACAAKADVTAGFGGPQKYNYLGQNSNTEVSNRLNGERRMFAFKSGNLASEEFMNSVQPKDGEHVNTYDWHFFKPYLILNDSLTPPMIYKDDMFEYNNEDEDAIKDFLDVKDSENVLIGDSVVEGDYLKHIIAAGQQNIASKYTNSDGKSELRLLKSQYAGQSLFFLNKAGVSVVPVIYQNGVDEDDDLGNRYEDMFKTVQFHSGTGFEGYMRMIAKGLGVSADIISDTLALSGEVVNKYIQMVYGYKGDFKQFVLDFTVPAYPVGFSMSDVDPETGAYNMVNRYARYFRFKAQYKPFLKDVYGNLGIDFLYGESGGNNVNITSSTPESRMNDPKYNNGFFANKGEESDDSAEPQYEKSDSFKDTTTYTSEKAETPDNSTEEAKKPRTDAEIRAEVEAEYGDMLKNNIIPRLRSKHKYKASLTVDIMYEIMIQCMVEAVKERGE